MRLVFAQVENGHENVDQVAVADFFFGLGHVTLDDLSRHFGRVRTDELDQLIDPEGAVYTGGNPTDLQGKTLYL